MLIALGTVPEPPFALNVIVTGSRAGISIDVLHFEVVDSPPPFNTVLIATVWSIDALLYVYTTDLIAFVSTPTRFLLDIEPDTVD